MRSLSARFLVATAALLLVRSVAFALPSIPIQSFQPSSGCGCHSGLAADWQPSMHAKALSDPLYRYKLAEADKATNGALGPFCNSCHGPIAVMSGQLTGVDQSKMTSASAEGVTCDFCHRVTGTGVPVANVSQTVANDQVKRAQIKDPQSPHPAAYSEFHKTAEFCGACHDVIHPAVPGLLLEATYTEWKASPYAQQGIVCQDCHMTRGPGPTVPGPRRAAGTGPERLGIHSMTFVGGNVGLGDRALAEERLKAAAAVTLSVPKGAKSGQSVVVTATVANVGAGHYLPTGLTEVREMWLEVSTQGADGEKNVVGERRFGTILKDAAGKHPVELWEATAIYSDDRIPPLESVVQTTTITVGEAPVTVAATLYYRSAPEEMATKAGVELPTTEMAAASASLRPADWDGKSGASSQEETASGSTLPVLVVAVIVVGAVIGTVLWMRRRKPSSS